LFGGDQAVSNGVEATIANEISAEIQ